MVKEFGGQSALLKVPGVHEPKWNIEKFLKAVYLIPILIEQTIKFWWGMENVLYSKKWKVIKKWVVHLLGLGQGPVLASYYFTTV